MATATEKLPERPLYYAIQYDAASEEWIKSHEVINKIRAEGKMNWNWDASKRRPAFHTTLLFMGNNKPAAAADTSKKTETAEAKVVVAAEAVPAPDKGSVEAKADILACLSMMHGPASTTVATLMEATEATVTVTIRVTSIVWNDKACVLQVELPSGIPCANAKPHITVALAKGVPAVYSNQLLAAFDVASAPPTTPESASASPTSTGGKIHSVQVESTLQGHVEAVFPAVKKPKVPAVPHAAAAGTSGVVGLVLIP